MTQKNNLSIIIVTYNSEKYIVDCISKLVDSTKTIKGVSFVVIDNKSSDKTLKNIRDFLIKTKKIQLSLIENDNNYGFARAVNQGIKSLKSRFYLLINPDLMVNSDTVTKIIRCQKIIMKF